MSEISTNNQFLEKLKVQCDLGGKVFVSKSKSMEIFILIKSTGASFLDPEEFTDEY